MIDPNEPELPPIAEGRRTARKRVILGGKIVCNEGSYTYDCRIRDLSEGGARVVVAAGVIIPMHMVLIDTRAGIAYESEVVWLKAPDFGLKFLATHSIRGVLPPQLQYLKRYNTTF